MPTRTATESTTATAPPAPGPALCDYALAELAAAENGLGEPGDALHEGVHQARKALRRTRATLALGDGILGPGMALLDRELRRLNTGLSPLRDAHALVETLDRLLDRKLGNDTRQLLAQAREVACATRAARTEQYLATDPDLAQRRALIALLRAALPALAWSRLTPAALRIALADTDTRLPAARERALSSGDDADWHRWRRRARRASQQRRALDAIGLAVAAAAASPFDKRSTERLGEAQDLSLLLAHCRDGSPFSKDQIHALRRYARPALTRLRHRIQAAQK